MGDIPFCWLKFNQTSTSDGSKPVKTGGRSYGYTCPYRVSILWIVLLTNFLNYATSLTYILHRMDPWASYVLPNPEDIYIHHFWNPPPDQVYLFSMFSLLRIIALEMLTILEGQFPNLFYNWSETSLNLRLLKSSMVLYKIDAYKYL